MLNMVLFLVLLVAAGGGGWFAWRHFGGGSGALFGGGRDSRIGVSEVASVDGKRKLVLIHRDGVEHLIMTGGPIDVVIEQGILPQRRPVAVQAAMPVQAQAFEPRFAVQPAAVASEPLLDPSAGFGRLRQRTSATAPDLHPRADLSGLASGGGVR